ncbi:MAG: presqualene diphosphate synthase HpnD [Acidobacteria bacterium]|nr:presqualene diphosphate synthase HpnD [Acidobacteriota bacterium]
MSRQHPQRFTNARATNFYYSFVFLPPEKREAIEAVYAFARRSDDVADSNLPAQEARQQLELCWRDLDRCYKADKLQAQDFTPELAALARAVHRFHIPREHFEELLRGIEMDLSPHRYRTFEELSLYCYRVASTIGLISIEIFGYKNLLTRRYAANLGMALQLVNILRDLQSDARRGRVYLPEEDLERFGVPPESFLEGNPCGKFIDLMEFESERARRYFALARQALPSQDRRAMVIAEIMGALYWRLLTHIKCRNYDVFGERVRLPRPLKFWIALSVYCGRKGYKS